MFVLSRALVVPLTPQLKKWTLVEIRKVLISMQVVFSWGIPEWDKGSGTGVGLAWAGVGLAKTLSAKSYPPSQFESPTWRVTTSEFTTFSCNHYLENIIPCDYSCMLKAKLAWLNFFYLNLHPPVLAADPKVKILAWTVKFLPGQLATSDSYILAGGNPASIWKFRNISSKKNSLFSQDEIIIESQKSYW